MRHDFNDWRAHLMGLELIRAREAAGLTQRELAERVGMVWQTIASLERSDNQTSLVRYRAIADALGVPLAQILAPYLDETKK